MRVLQVASCNLVLRVHPPMEPVLSVDLGQIQKAYPLSLLKKKPAEFEDRVGNVSLMIHFDKSSTTAYFTACSGEVLPSIMVYWFAWRDFFPQTQVLAKER